MKKILRKYTNHLLVFWLISFIPNLFVFSHHASTIFITALVFTLLDIIIRPALKIIFMPISLATFGLLSWIPSVIILFLTSLLVSDFTIHPLVLPSSNILGLNFPPVSFGVISTLIISSLLVFLLKKIIIWIHKKDKD